MTLASLAESRAPQNPVEPVPLTKLEATAPESRPRTMVCTPSGHWVYQAEGGALAVFEVFQNGVYTDAEFKTTTGHKKFKLSSMGVLASRMALDPLAADPPVDGANDLIYVAGGRDGLWMVAADTTPSAANPAWRIDDSGNTNPATQKGRRWCTDVGFMTVNGTDYLLACFAKKDESRLRVYDLNAARQPEGSFRRDRP